MLEAAQSGTLGETLAALAPCPWRHELGHAIHLTLAADNQKFINNSHSLLFIESPSTLVEHLIVQYLEKNRTDPRLLRWLNMYQMMSYHHNCVTHILEAELLRRLYKMA